MARKTAKQTLGDDLMTAMGITDKRAQAIRRLAKRANKTAADMLAETITVATAIKGVVDKTAQETKQSVGKVWDSMKESILDGSLEKSLKEMTGLVKQAARRGKKEKKG